MYFFCSWDYRFYNIYNNRRRKTVWTWVLNIEEPVEWIIRVWPLIVSVVLIGSNSTKLLIKIKDR